MLGCTTVEIKSLRRSSSRHNFGCHDSPSASGVDLTVDHLKSMSLNRQAAAPLLCLTAIFLQGLAVEIHETFLREDQSSCIENNAAACNTDPVSSRKISLVREISPTGTVSLRTPEVLQKDSTFTQHYRKRKGRRVGFSHRDVSGDDSRKPYLDAFRYSLLEQAQIPVESPSETRARAEMARDEEVRNDVILTRGCSTVQ